jgi:hypothetical protein
VPAAADGLVRLVKHRPELQEPLRRFLERIPIKSAQPWIVNGWNEAFDDQNLRQFEGLINQWMEQTENKPLSGIAKLQKRGRPNLNKGK